MPSPSQCRKVTRNLEAPSMSHHIGTAGYVYAHWRKGAFYPPGVSQSEELSHYLSNFPSVEINATWHAFPRSTTLQKWRSAAHPQTRFALKAPAVITHQKRLQNAEQDIHAFVKLAKEGLRDHLGPILFQCPPSLPVSITLLEQFLATIRTAADEYGPFRVALEFRSPDWFCRPVYGLLAEADIALVNNIAVKDTDFAVLDDLFPHARNVQHPTASWQYNRFHGSKNPGVLTDFPDSILRQFADQQGVQYSFFLNDWAAIAPKNAEKYARLCAEAKGIELKSLFDGFVPQWSRPKPSIKSFFTPVSKSTSKESRKTKADQSSQNGSQTRSTLSTQATGSPSPSQIVKSPVRLRKKVQQGTTLSPKSSSIVKSPVKVAKPAIQKKRSKPIAKDIASFFSSASDKG